MRGVALNDLNSGYILRYELEPLEFRMCQFKFFLHKIIYENNAVS